MGKGRGKREEREGEWRGKFPTFEKSLNWCKTRGWEPSSRRFLILPFSSQLLKTNWLKGPSNWGFKSTWKLKRETDKWETALSSWSSELDHESQHCVEPRIQLREGQEAGICKVADHHWKEGSPGLLLSMGLPGQQEDVTKKTNFSRFFAIFWDQITCQ